MEEIFESKNLFVNFNYGAVAFNVLPFRDGETQKLMFQIDLLDGKIRTIQYEYVNGWWQLTGPQIFTDLLHFIGVALVKHYPQYF